MSAKSMYKPKPVKKEPRSTEDINKEYTAYAQLLGDKQVKIHGLEKDKEQILFRIDQLGTELTERQKLDKGQTPENTNDSPKAMIEEAKS